MPSPLDWLTGSTGAHLVVLPVMLLEFAVLNLPLAIIPDMQDDYFGASVYNVVGASVGFRGIIAFFSSPVIGSLSDSHGRRPLLLLTTIGSAFPVIVLAFTDNMAFYQVAVSLSGFFYATFPIIFAFVADIVPNDERAPAIGLVLATFGLSFAVAPITGAEVAEAWGHRAVFVFCALLLLGNVLYVLLRLPEPLQPRDRPTFKPADMHPLRAFATLRESPFLSKLAWIVLCYYTAQWGVRATLLLYMTRVFHFSTVDKGAFLMLFGALTMVCESVVVRVVVPRYGERKCAWFGCVVFAAQCALYGVAWEGWVLFLGLFLALGTNLTYPSLASLVSRAVPADRQGEALGAMNGVAAATEGLGPLLFANIMSYTEDTSFPGLPYVLAAGFAAMAAVMCAGIEDHEVVLQPGAGTTMGVIGSSEMAALTGSGSGSESEDEDELVL